MLCNNFHHWRIIGALGSLVVSTSGTYYTYRLFCAGPQGHAALQPVAAIRDRRTSVDWRDLTAAARRLAAGEQPW
jgi:hypothetical protein